MPHSVEKRSCWIAPPKQKFMLRMSSESTSRHCLCQSPFSVSHQVHHEPQPIPLFELILDDDWMAPSLWRRHIVSLVGSSENSYLTTKHELADSIHGHGNSCRIRLKHFGLGSRDYWKCRAFVDMIEQLHWRLHGLCTLKSPQLSHVDRIS